MVLPSGSTDGILCMLEAYFDDSGTHDDSEIVLWAGLFGNRYQWEFFNQLWAKKLADPSPGKPPIKRFHMVDCYNSTGEFAGWRRAATDFLAHELTNVITAAMLRGYAIAISRKDWDQAFPPGQWRNAFGDAEGICLRNIYLQLIEQVSRIGESQIALVFDERPHRTQESRAVFGIFDRYQKQENVSPELVSIAFSSASKLLPLQAADLFAWECYQHALQLTRNKTRQFAIKRKNLATLIGSKRIALGMADRAAIEQMRAAFEGEEANVEAVAQHMKTIISSGDLS